MIQLSDEQLNNLGKEALVEGLFFCDDHVFPLSEFIAG